jgi:hypothetical protein
VDAAEGHAENFLRGRCHTIVHWPDGRNNPPDFLADNRIAVEVMRLNHRRGTGTEAIPLWRGVKKLALSLGEPTHGASWPLYFRFSRPIVWKTLRPKLKQKLVCFRNSGTHQRKTLELGNEITVEIYQPIDSCKTFYVLLGHNQFGGFLFEEIKRDIVICINKKTAQIKKFKAKYPEWWLVLVDLTYGLDCLDIKQFRAQVSIPYSWTKVIVLDARDPTRVFEI